MNATEETIDWLTIRRGAAPLLVSLPHTGTTLPDAVAARLLSRSRALKDTDWWIDRLYDFAAALDATIVHTAISRTVIDVNRDPSGASLYPGQATTGLCPTTTFDGDPLYHAGQEPDQAEIERRRDAYFAPYHAALASEIARLRGSHERIVVYDCHSIRSEVPRLFEGTLPNFNIGTNDGRSAAPELTALAEAICDASGFSRVTNGRFKGGWITRSLGDPAGGVHAIQMELACRGYMDELAGDEPAPYDADRAAPMRAVLVELLTALKDWAGR
ncbi:N-formylglutamate deformylase [Kaistia dalseonensis]|nr:N-formylglutamate deformylase [Kaistia dalseonensis]MCX5493293.1 N-formylglutamate deformylase [Kaistia dalseonensis]